MNEKKIDALLVLDEVSLHHHVELTPDEAEYYAARVHGYNNLTTRGFLAFVKGANKAMVRMDFGPGNPNTGGYFHGWMAGNESSKVMYLVARKSYVRGREAEVAAAFRKAAVLAKSAKADEIMADDNDYELRLRVWWD